MFLLRKDNFTCFSYGNHPLTKPIAKKIDEGEASMIKTLLFWIIKH